MTDADLRNAGRQDTDVGKIAQTAVVAASVPTGRTIIGDQDAFVRNQSRFDRQARVCLQETALKVDERVYRDYCASQVTAWEADEIAALKQIIAWVAGRFAGWPVRLPSTVHLVKTTGQEEGRGMGKDSPLWPQYLGKIGLNLTDELFHPDEIVAQDFVLTALLPTATQLTDIDKLLKKGGNSG